MFLAMIADGKTAASDTYTGEKARETAETQPEPASGWVLIGRVFVRSLTLSSDRQVRALNCRLLALPLQHFYLHDEITNVRSLACHAANSFNDLIVVIPDLNEE